MQKRGSVEVQFNWIFAFVAGAMILVFFVGFINTQAQSAERKLAATVIRDMDTIMTQSSVSAGKSDVINLAKPLEFICEPICNTQGCDSSFFVPKTGIDRKTPVQVIFAPSLIYGREMVTWSQDWSVPFRVTNFLYLTSKDLRYVFVTNDNSDLDKIRQEFPANINTDQVDNMDLVTNQNNYKVRFILDTAPTSVPVELLSMFDKDVTALHINSGTSKIQFCHKQGGIFNCGPKIGYIGKQSLYGAIISDNIDMYECNMKKALVRLSKVGEVYKEKSLSLLQIYTDSTDPCNGAYNNIKSDIISSIASAETIFPGDLTTFNLDIGNIITSSENIKLKNNILKMHSCPLIY